MSSALLITIFVSVAVSAFFIWRQWSYFNETKTNRDRYQNFFNHTGEYQTRNQFYGNKEIFLIDEENLPNGSDLKQLVIEINEYVRKNVGTTDFSVIQNKTERKLNMRYDESMARIAFPTYYGLMGTFTGVFVGIITFILGFDGTNGVTDDSIRNLLIGVLVSMLTSLIGLALTTRNNRYASISKKQIDEDKNRFYDFIQNELMPTLDVSMVAALNKLHNTVNMFEPSFNRVIDRFQQTFDSCTAAFGDKFQKNVEVVSAAVGIMGDNMDKVNDNIDHQEKLLKTLKSRGIIESLERFVTAAYEFERITQSLRDFEKTRGLMLEATQKVIQYQNQYSESLEIPKSIASKMIAILNRITTFENSINALGTDIAQTQLIGNDTINLIQKQINVINKKGKLAAKYIDTADERLETLFKEQVNMINKMNSTYQAALQSHMDDYVQQMNKFIVEMEERRNAFLDSIRKRITVEQVHEDFSNLAKLNDIEQKLNALEAKVVSAQDLQRQLQAINKILEDVKNSASKSDSRNYNTSNSNASKSNKHPVVRPQNNQPQPSQVNTSQQSQVNPPQPPKQRSWFPWGRN